MWSVTSSYSHLLPKLYYPLQGYTEKSKDDKKSISFMSKNVCKIFWRLCTATPWHAPARTHASYHLAWLDKNYIFATSKLKLFYFFSLQLTIYVRLCVACGLCFDLWLSSGFCLVSRVLCPRAAQKFCCLSSSGEVIKWDLLCPLSECVCVCVRADWGLQ